MRYPKEHKDQTRRRVVEVASARFRREGLDGVGVASLMSEAGLTHGGFYSHFPSKEALIEEVFASGMEENFQRLAEASEQGGIEGFVGRYLRPGNREHPERSCPAGALGSEIHRHSRKAREAFARKLERTVAKLRELLPASRKDRAEAIFAVLVGTIQLARAVPDLAQSDQILESGKAAALALATEPNQKEVSPQTPSNPSSNETPPTPPGTSNPVLE
jgi:AcrR family transcriptional regulator